MQPRARKPWSVSLHHSVLDATVHVQGDKCASLLTREQGIERRLVPQLHRAVKQRAMGVQRIGARLAPQLAHQPAKLLVIKCEGPILQRQREEGKRSGLLPGEWRRRQQWRQQWPAALAGADGIAGWSHGTLWHCSL